MMRNIPVTDPFAVKRYSKWHPYRLAYTLNARIAERVAKATFEANALPIKQCPSLPECPSADWDDTAVTPEQTQYLLHGVQATEHLNSTCLVEIGAYRGVTTLTLARATARPYFAVDPYLGYTGSEINLQKFEQRLLNQTRVTLVRQTSGDAARGWESGPVSFCFIDAIHDYVNVRFDIAAWSSLIVPGGIIAFHDADTLVRPGVRRAIKEVANSYELFAHVHDLVMLRKVSSTSV